MLKITLLCIGTLKEKYWKDALAEYQKRLSRFADFSVVEVPEQERKTVAETLNAECKKLEEKIKGEVVLLDVNGKMLSSPQFSQLINKLSLNSRQITFVVGGSNGFSQEFKEAHKTSVSFSSFTFPHQMARVLIAEQIYRAMTILNNVPYHK